VEELGVGGGEGDVEQSQTEGFEGQCRGYLQGEIFLDHIHRHAGSTSNREIDLLNVSFRDYCLGRHDTVSTCLQRLYKLH
jgi:hypothetical protein